MKRAFDHFFEQGFRPFFLGASLWAALGMSVWTLTFRSDLSPDFFWTPARWHVHEMLFGYVSAVIAGFLLTAVPNWTGVAAPKGARLAGLFALWIAGRFTIAFANDVPSLLVAALDVSFLVFLEVWLIKALVKSGNKRNLVVAGIVGLLIISNLAMHADALETLGKRGGLLTVLMLISLIGGRVIPAFTRNWLAAEGIKATVAPFGLPDKLALATTALALLLYAAQKDGAVMAGAFVIASLCGFVRLSRWQVVAARREPLVWIMHLAYLWLPVGYALMALSQVTTIIDERSALHALTTGAVGTMTLAIMARATLGHSGKALKANRATLVMFFLITLSALIRVSSGVFPDPVLSNAAAGLAWTLAFAVFAAVYGRHIVARRVEDM